jgi:hypothetical protein
VPASALAAPTTAHLPEIDTTNAGCEPKGLGGFGVPAGPPGNMPPGAYRYIVEAVVPGGNPAPCQEVIVRNAPGSNTILLQWRPTLGATGYNVYRTNPNVDGTPGAATPTRVIVGNPAAQGPACPNTRCFFVDPVVAANAGPAAPATVPDNNDAGAHTDLRIRQTVDYGGTNTNSDPFTGLADDPFSFNAPTGGANEALRRDIFRFPAGLIANPRASATCDLTGDDSLLGSLDAHGSDDPEEDACPQTCPIRRPPTRSTPAACRSRSATSTTPRPSAGSPAGCSS